MRRVLQAAVADKEGVTVSRPNGLDLGVIDLSSAAHGARTHLIVKTTYEDQSIKFIRAKVRPSSGLTSSTSCESPHLRVQFD
jgi:hypothetical protein